ncbi:ureidoglycolate lyase [Microvirga sp. TS319]|uniref:ureidoglycolate lyase n=1 Tax=Microvirga sp. TS319 TaxID=3241165 RepID=UPI00351AA389
MTASIIVQPLTKEGFAPFGKVLETAGAETRLINAETCTRFHALATVETRGECGRAIVSLFQAKPIALPLRLSMMERHPLGSQAFWPLSGGDWLVAVAPDENGRPGAPLVFRASGSQGVCYAPNVWHHPLLALDQVSEFLVVDRDGPGLNLQETYYETPYAIATY